MWHIKCVSAPPPVMKVESEGLSRARVPYQCIKCSIERVFVEPNNKTQQSQKYCQSHAIIAAL